MMCVRVTDSKFLAVTRTGWASQVTAKDVDWPCLPQFTYLGVIFGHDNVDHGPTDKRKAGLFLFLFLSARYGRCYNPKKIQKRQ